jgi:hypothetical protein
MAGLVPATSLAMALCLNTRVAGTSPAMTAHVVIQIEPERL